jgi:type II secretory pathway pseudopilin PulG
MKKNKSFTLLELILAMGILTVIMVLMLSFFSAAQKAWMTSSANAEIYENARVAMDLMTRDLQTALYNDENSSLGIYPFWHESDSKISFISATGVGDADDLINIIREVKYARSNGTTLTLEDLPVASGATLLKGGWLVRSVTGASSVDSVDKNDKTDQDNKYNFQLFPRSPYGPNRVYRIFKEMLGGTNTAYKSSQDFNYVVPHVVSLKFSCYNNRVQDMRDIDGDGVQGTVLNGDAIYNYSSATTAEATYLPYAIGIEIVLLDRASWAKWKVMNGNVADPGSDPAAAKTFREAHQRTFTTMIYLGSRNSRDLP